MLSLSPRFDLFRFEIPKDYIPEEVLDKYNDILRKTPGVITNAIDYLNESIKGITIPGITDIITEQYQVSTNDIPLLTTPTIGGKINREPNHTNSTYSSVNPIDKIEREITVTFRMNQGLLNYFMLYETLFHRICKPELYETAHDQFVIQLLSQQGNIISKILLFQPKLSQIDGLEFDYSKSERQEDTFSVRFVYNNIDFDFCYKQ